MHRTRVRRGNGFFSDALYHTHIFGRNVDRFFRANGPRFQQIAAAVAPRIAPEAPGLAAGIAVGGQAAASYSSLRDQLDRT